MCEKCEKGFSREELKSVTPNIERLVDSLVQLGVTADSFDKTMFSLEKAKSFEEIIEVLGVDNVPGSIKALAMAYNGGFMEPIDEPLRTEMRKMKTLGLSFMTALSMRGENVVGFLGTPDFWYCLGEEAGWKKDGVMSEPIMHFHAYVNFLDKIYAELKEMNLSVEEQGSYRGKALNDFFEDLLTNKK